MTISTMIQEQVGVLDKGQLRNDDSAVVQFYVLRQQHIKQITAEQGIKYAFQKGFGL